MSKPEYSQKPGLMLLSDNGPDFNPLSLLNAIYFYRLFRALKYDFMYVKAFLKSPIREIHQFRGL